MLRDVPGRSKEDLAALRADILGLKLEIAKLELEMLRAGELSEDALQRITEMRTRVGGQEQTLDRYENEVAPLEEPVVRLHRIVKWAAIGAVACWCTYTVLVLTRTLLGGPTSHAKPDYYIAVATLLPLLLIAVFVQSAVPSAIPASRWMLIGLSAPIVAGEVVALYALAQGHATRPMVTQTVLASASAFAFGFLVLAFWEALR